MAEAELEDLPLPSLFSRGRAAAERAEEPVGGPGAAARAERQRQLASGLAALRRASAAVDSLALFSANGENEDLATADLKYLLIPFYRAQLLAQLQPDSMQGRRDALQAAVQQYRAYLLVARQYELLSPQAAAMAEAALERHDEGEGDAGGSGRAVAAGLDPATLRQHKIDKFKRERAIKARLAELQVVEAGAGDADDASERGGSDAEERAREAWLLQLDLAGLQAAERVATTAQEVALLQHAASLSPEQRAAPPADAAEGNELLRALRDASATLFTSSRREQLRSNALFKPTVAQPTLSVEQQGEIELRQALEAQQRQTAAEERQRRREAEVHPDDKEEAELQKQRAWEDWKDDNPRGWGNSKLRPCA